MKKVFRAPCSNIDEFLEAFKRVGELITASYTLSIDEKINGYIELEVEVKEK